jgi:protoporphyrinogen oxidase
VEAIVDGRNRIFEGSHFISSMPIRALVDRLDPGAPSEVQEAARSLQYRDFITVALIIDKEHLFPDNWIYVHDPAVKLGRIQNFKNWSPDMLISKTCPGSSTFVSKGTGSGPCPIGADRARENELKMLAPLPADVIDGMVVSSQGLPSL